VILMKYKFRTLYAYKNNYYGISDCIYLFNINIFTFYFFNITVFYQVNVRLIYQQSMYVIQLNWTIDKNSNQTY